MASRTLVIAEPGCTHEGSYDAICSLIDVAAQSGANVFKNQWMSDPEAVIQRRTAKLPPAEAEAFAVKYRPCYQWLSYPIRWHRDFAQWCHDAGMLYGCSVYLPRDVWTVEPHVDLFKISSFERLDSQLRGTADTAGKPVVVSFGMHNEEFRRPPENALVCTSAYPCPLSAANLNLIRKYGFHGLSDHTRNVTTGGVAVGAGAKTIEAHFRLDDCDPSNHDYAVAFSPAEFTQYILNIRDAEQMLGNGLRGLQPCEREMSKYRVGV